MARPGTTITRSDSRATRSARTGTGPWYVAGITGTADVDADPTKSVPSLAEYARRFGSRADHVTAGEATLYDEAELYFADGGSEMFVSPTADATAPILDAALALFPYDLGPGQVSAPGRTTAAEQIIVAARAALNNRVAIIDFADTVNVATLVAASDPAGITTPQRRVSGGFGGSWPIIPPAAAGGANRTVPPSALVAALMSRNDAQGISPNAPSAGTQLGVSSYAIGVSQTYTDDDRNTLNQNGVNILRMINGQVVVYGYRTLADPVDDFNYIPLSNARLFMAIQAVCDAVAQRFVFRQIDGQGLTINEFGGALIGAIVPFWQQRSLYGTTSGSSFRVDVGSTVNTVDTIANGELHAKIYLKMSPFAEEVVIDITKTKTTEAV